MAKDPDGIDKKDLKGLVNAAKENDKSLETISTPQAVRMLRGVLGVIQNELQDRTEGTIRLPGFGVFKVASRGAGEEAKKRIVFRLLRQRKPTSEPTG